MGREMEIGRQTETGHGDREREGYGVVDGERTMRCGRDGDREGGGDMQGDGDRAWRWERDGD